MAKMLRRVQPAEPEKPITKKETEPTPLFEKEIIADGNTEAFAAEQMELLEIPFDKIQVGMDGMLNSRSGDLKVGDLFESIQTYGLMEPIGVWNPPGKNYYVLARGFRRYEAIRQIRLEDPEAFKTLHVTVFSGPLTDAMLMNLEENVRRDNLNHADLIDTVYRLYANRGVKEIDLAKQLGKSQGYISSLIGIKYKCHAKILEALRQELITLEDVRALAGTSPDNQLEALETLLGSDRADEIRKLMKKEKGNYKPSKKELISTVRQIQAYDVPQDKDYRAGVVSGILYAIGQLDDKATLHPVALTEVIPEIPDTGRKRGRPAGTGKKFQVKDEPVE